LLEQPNSFDQSPTLPLSLPTTPIVAPETSEISAVFLFKTAPESALITNSGARYVRCADSNHPCIPVRPLGKVYFHWYLGESVSIVRRLYHSRLLEILTRDLAPRGFKTMSTLHVHNVFPFSYENLKCHDISGNRVWNEITKNLKEISAWKEGLPPAGCYLRTKKCLDVDRSSRVRFQAGRELRRPQTRRRPEIRRHPPIPAKAHLTSTRRMSSTAVTPS
jgi:hypothetical protein